MPPRRYILHEANYRQLLDRPPSVALLPWGATEAHNYHLPHGTDVAQVTALAAESARKADANDARVIVLPTIPIGNDEMQLEGQVATLSITTATAGAILDDIARCLKKQGIDRLLLLNGHGGNEFRPLIRDMQVKHDILIVLIDFWAIVPEKLREIFDDPGDHAGQLETALMLHLHPEWVVMEQAGEGRTVAYDVPGLTQPGVWTPRPWSRVHPDTGCGNPTTATAAQGEAYLDALSSAIGEVLVNLSNAKRGELPYGMSDG